MSTEFTDGTTPEVAWRIDRASRFREELLDLCRLRLTRVPDLGSLLPDLRELDLSHNLLDRIPESVRTLSKLEALIVADNLISTVPKWIGELRSLRTLNISNNKIDNLPRSLVQLGRLTHLFLHGNVELEVPDEILGPRSTEVYLYGQSPKPPKEILRYFFAQQSGSRPLNEAKLIIVGRGGTGKTSLIKKLTTGHFTEGERSTEGIKITDWRCSLSPEDEVSVHIWDFGGQEMMHATHQFFLTPRSLYLLVLNRRSGGIEEEVDYWLRLIRAFGGRDAPVIVVLNKQRYEPFDLNREGLIDRYPTNIRSFIETDCEDNTSITALEAVIAKQLRLLKSVKANFPSRWFEIKEELAAMADEYISFNTYREICDRHGEPDPELQNSLSGFLHDLGIALNYKDDSRLRFAYVLKPWWVTLAIYKLLHSFVKSKGLFTVEEAQIALSSLNYTVQATDFILHLMERFELSFPLNNPSNQILIPQLLDDQQPDSVRQFDVTKTLNFGYQYPILPEGLVPRFIVRTHHLSTSENRWKSGVVLKHSRGNCRALVRANSADRQVRIYIDGDIGLHKELLAIVRHNFEIIHSDYEFAPEQLVYPSNAPEKSVAIEELQALRRDGESTVKLVLPNKTVLRSNIDNLVNSVTLDYPKLRLFLSYAHCDEKFVKELKKDLILLERNGFIRVWYDRDLVAGQKWEATLLNELEEADIVVCQLTRDFLASDFCALVELQTAIEKKKRGQVELVAYVLKECGWREVGELSQFQLLPKDAKPISEWKSKDAYWRAVADGIQKAVLDLRERLRVRSNEQAPDPVL